MPIHHSQNPKGQKDASRAPKDHIIEPASSISERERAQDSLSKTSVTLPSQSFRIQAHGHGDSFRLIPVLSSGDLYNEWCQSFPNALSTEKQGIHEILNLLFEEGLPVSQKDLWLQLLKCYKELGSIFQDESNIRQKLQLFRHMSKDITREGPRNSRYVEFLDFLDELSSSNYSGYLRGLIKEEKFGLFLYCVYSMFSMANCLESARTFVNNFPAFLRGHEQYRNISCYTGSSELMYIIACLSSRSVNPARLYVVTSFLEQCRTNEPDSKSSSHFSLRDSIQAIREHHDIFRQIGHTGPEHVYLLMSTLVAFNLTKDTTQLQQYLDHVRTNLNITLSDDSELFKAEFYNKAVKVGGGSRRLIDICVEIKDYVAPRFAPSPKIGHTQIDEKLRELAVKIERSSPKQGAKQVPLRGEDFTEPLKRINAQLIDLISLNQDYLDPILMQAVVWLKQEMLKFYSSRTYEETCTAYAEDWFYEMLKLEELTASGEHFDEREFDSFVSEHRARIYCGSNGIPTENHFLAIRQTFLDIEQRALNRASSLKQYLDDHDNSFLIAYFWSLKFNGYLFRAPYEYRPALSSAAKASREGLRNYFNRQTQFDANDSYREKRDTTSVVD